MSRGKWIAVVWGSLLAGSVFGAGFQLYTEGSAEALGQAGAISGRDDLISLAWYNPAALAGADRPAVMVGATFAQIKTDYRNALSPAANASMSDDWRTIPHLYYIQPISEEWTTMLSINAPYGLITEWPNGWAGAALATYSELETIYITPSVSWKPTEIFSVGLGLNVVNAEAELQNAASTLKGDDINYGGAVSARYQPFDDWAIGARYQSSVKLELTGSVNGFVPVAADLELPSSLNAGIANTSIENLTLGLDLVWTEWSTYDQLIIELPDPPAGPGPQVTPKQWDDVISIRFGGEYALGESWALRAGYVWDESPVPDSTRSPELPGSDRQMLMAGLGWKTGGVGIDLAYSYLWAEDADMGSLITTAAPPLAGTFETVTHLVALSVSYSF